MAKSLRSKSKRAHRAIKRTDPKSAFKIADDLRLHRLNAKLKASALKPKDLTDAEEYQRKQDGYETEEEDENVEPIAVEGDQPLEKDMQLDGGDSAEASTSEPVKVSTSGPRFTGREQFKAKKGLKIRSTPKTHFRTRGETRDVSRNRKPKNSRK